MTRLLNPVQLFRRIRSAICFRSNPSAPWLCPDAIRLLQSHLDPRMCALEFGSGRSTTWIGKRVGSHAGIEYIRDWHQKILKLIRGNDFSDITCWDIPLDHPSSDPEREAYDPLPNYLLVCDEFDDASLDFILVDGHYRTHCVRQARRLIKSCGLLMVGDAQRWDSLPVGPRSLLPDWDASNGVKLTTTWRRS